MTRRPARSKSDPAAVNGPGLPVQPALTRAATVRPTSARHTGGLGRAVEPAGPRIVIAHDLSAEADRAVTVVATAPWPPTTIVRIVTSSTGLGRGSSSFALVRETRARAAGIRASIETAQARAAGTLAGKGIHVETTIVAGRPGPAVVTDAIGFGADLIVSGGRGQHPLVATLIGSVSTQITERAPSSVLITRVESIGRVILATDGSVGADAATDVVASSPLFSTSEIRIVGVASPPSNYTGSVLSRDVTEDSYADSLAKAREFARTQVDAALGRLAEVGHQAKGDIRVGNPAEEILAATREWPADIVVVGSTGRSLIHRLILGNVARTVLHRSPSSVLIARSQTSSEPT
jgi:nucleotide-binding universal stress UspA family protein